MNTRIKEIAEQAGLEFDDDETLELGKQIYYVTTEGMEEFAQLIAQQCADICTEMAAKCAGLPDDGAVARDCADWIRKDFGVEQ